MSIEVGSSAPYAVPTKATYSHPNDTVEHIVFSISNTDNRAQDFVVRFDLSAITKTNFKLRLYTAIDGLNYVLHTTSTLGASNDMGQFEEPLLCSSLRVTAQSTIAEGAIRSLPYEYATVRR